MNPGHPSDEEDRQRSDRDDSTERDGLPPDTAPADASSSDAAEHLSFIEQVLQGTNAGAETPADLEALKQVAMRHRGRELTPDPIGIELVAAILKSQLPGIKQSAADRDEMVEQIATAIFGTDDLQDRLERFWDQLCESV